MSEPTATIPQFAEIPQFLGSSPARASTVLSILVRVGYNPESTPAAFKAVSMVDRSTTDSGSVREICQFRRGLMPVKGRPVMAINPAAPCVSEDRFVRSFVEVLKLAQAPLGHRTVGQVFNNEGGR